MTDRPLQAPGVPEPLAALVEETLAALGFRLVRLLLIPGDRRATLQVLAEPEADGAPMGIDQCVEITRALSPQLEVADPVKGAYVLEVSSPGIDRPLVQPEDFNRFEGETATLETAMPVDGRRRFRGTLLGYADGAVRIATEEHQEGVAIAFTALRKAALKGKIKTDVSAH